MGAAVPLDFLVRVLIHLVAPQRTFADTLERQLLHQHAYLGGAERTLDIAPDAVQDIGRGDEDALLARPGGTEMLQDELLFQVGRLETGVVRIEGVRFLGVEPVAEVVLPQVPGLGVDAGIVDGVLLGRVDVFHLEGQPAAVATGVAEEGKVVARGAEAGDVGPALLVAPVGGPLVDAVHGHDGLQLVQRGGGHLVNLLQTDEDELAQAEEVVLGGAVGADAGLEIALQLQRQQVVEPGGLVAALPADEHEDLVVDVARIQHARHEADEPLAEVFPEAFLAALDVHGVGQPGNVVGDTVPGRQSLQILFEWMEGGDKLGVEHVVDVALAGAAHLLVYARPEGVDVAVGERGKRPVRAVDVGHLALAGEEVVPEDALGAQVLLYLLDAASGATTRSMPFPRPTGAVILGMGIARGDDRGGIAVIVREGLDGPSGAVGLGHAVGIEQIAHAHDVLIVVMRFVSDAFLLQLPPGGSDGRFQRAGSRTPLGSLGSDRLLQVERLRLGVEEDVRVVGQSAETGGILALEVARTAQQFRIVAVGLFEELPIQLLVLSGVGAQPVDAEKDAQAMPADGDVDQQRMRVGAGLAAKLFQPPLFDVVDVRQAQAGPVVDVRLSLAALETHGHGEAGSGEFLATGSNDVTLQEKVTVFFGMIPHYR